MNKKQWYVLGAGLFIFGWWLQSFPGICLGEGDLLISCYIRRYAMTVPGLILSALGILFAIMGALEPKKKH